MPILPIDSGRYGSKEIKKIFEEEQHLQYQLDFEAAVSTAQAHIKMIPEYASDDITKKAKSGKITIEKVKELEAVTEHDTAAIVEALSEQCSEKSRPWIHYGLTSNDILDTTISMQMRDAFSILESKILDIATALTDKALEFRTLPAVGRTHGQHASIIAFGLKFAVWAAEMAKHIERIEEGKKRFLLCKTLGVVGTGSLMGNRALDVQRRVAMDLRLYAVEAATQVIPRERHAEMQFLIALVACTLDKIAIEIRNLQRTEIGEVAEPFRRGQIGSSAVPVKRNPIKSERVSLPMAVILLDEMLNSMKNVIIDLNVNTKRITSNLDITKGQIYAEFVLEALIKKGVPRFEAYRNIQRVAFAALEREEDFFDALRKDSNLSKNLTPLELKGIFNAKNHLSASSKIIENVVRKVKATNKKYHNNQLH